MLGGALTALICQQVAATHVDCVFQHLHSVIASSHDHIAISSLGDDLTYKLVKPVLERCSPDQLLRLEHTSPVCPLDLRTNLPELIALSSSALEG